MSICMQGLCINYIIKMPLHCQMLVCVYGWGDGLLVTGTDGPGGGQVILVPIVRGNHR